MFSDSNAALLFSELVLCTGTYDILPSANPTFWSFLFAQLLQASSLHNVTPKQQRIWRKYVSYLLAGITSLTVSKGPWLSWARPLFELKTYKGTRHSSVTVSGRANRV